jgi:WD40 repeat protein
MFLLAGCGGSGGSGKKLPTIPSDSELHALEETFNQSGSADPSPSGRGGADPILVRDCLVTFPQGFKQDVPAERDGKIMDIKVKQGDKVNKGDLLAQLDDKLATADVAIGEAKVNVSAADITVTEKIRDEMLQKAKTSALLKKGGAAAEEQVRLDYLTAEKYKYDVFSKGDAKVVAEKELDKSKHIEKMHKIRSHTDGIVKSVLKQPGEVVKTFGTMFEIHNSDRVQVEGLVDIHHLHRLQSKPLDQFRVVIEYAVPVGPQSTLIGHLGPVNCVAVSKDAKKPLIVSGSDDGYMIVWDRSGRELRRLKHPRPVLSVACTGPKAAENLCLSGDVEGRIRLWDLANGSPKLLRELQDPAQGQKAHAGGVTALAFSPDGKSCVSGGKDREILLWDTATGALRYKFPSLHRGAITSLQFPLATRLVSASEDFTLALWDVGEEHAQLVRAPLPSRSCDVAVPGVSSDGQRVLFDQAKFLRVLSLPGGRTEAVLKNPSSAANFTKFALFSPDNRLILTAGSSEGWMQLWRAPDAQSRGYEVRQLESFEESTCAMFAPDGSFLVTGTQENQVLIWPVPSASEVHQPLNGRLTYVDKEVQSSDRQQVRIWAELDNPKQRLVPGTTVTMVIYDE